MLDYYGSVIKSEKEIDRELLQRFKNRCHEAYMKTIISDLRKENLLRKDYSVSGWMVFHSKTIYNTIEERINHYKSKQRLKFIYCFNHYFNDMDVCQMICDYI